MSEGLWNRIDGWNEAFLTVVAIILVIAAFCAIVWIGLQLGEKWEERRRRKQKPVPLIIAPRTKKKKE